MMDDKGELEQLRAAFRSLAADAKPADDCPEPEKLWDGIRGELTPDELRDVVDHTASCAACAEAWRIGLELEGGAAREETLPAAARTAAERRAMPAWWRYAAAAAMIVGAVGVARLGDWTGRSPQQDFRGGDVRGIVSLVPADAPLAADAFVLRWRLEGPYEAVRYEIRVTTEDFRTVAEVRDLDSSSYQVPETGLAALAPGALLLWQVEAVLADGNRLQSETFEVRLE